MNDTALLNLGKLVHGLAQKSSFVRIGVADTVMSKGMFTIKATKVRNGKTYEVTEMINEQVLEQISDPAVIVDVLVMKMDKSNA